MLNKEVAINLDRINREYNKLDNAGEEADAMLRKLNYVFSKLMDEVIDETNKIFN